jgi:hypothetical protein
MRDFKKYEVWQQSHAFTLKSIKSFLFSKEELYGLTSQIVEHLHQFQQTLVKDGETVTKSLINFLIFRARLF